MVVLQALKFIPIFLKIPFNRIPKSGKTTHFFLWFMGMVIFLGGAESKAQSFPLEPNGIKSTVLDTSLLERSLAYILKTYESTLKDNLKIYTGTELVNLGTKVKGSPYLEDDQFWDTDIFFEGVLYPHIPARFNLVSGELVIQDYLKKNLLEIKKEKVPFFIRNQNLFIRMVPDSDLNRNLKDGIYEVLWSKKIPIYLSRVKTAGTPSGVGVLDITYLELDHYFMKVDGRFYSCDDVHSFLKALPDKKEEMKAFIRTHKFSKNQDFKHYIKMLAAKYSEL